MQARYRILQKVQKKSKRKDTSDIWMSATDPVTQVSDPLRISLSGLVDNFYFAFFSRNNALVEAALQLHTDLEENYNQFLALGIRVMQQLGPSIDLIESDVDETPEAAKAKQTFRGRTYQIYQSMSAGLEATMRHRAPQFALYMRNGQLVSLCRVMHESTASNHDKQRLARQVDILKQQRIFELERHYEALDELVQRSSKDRNKYLMEFFPQINDDMKLLYFETMKCEHLRGNPSDDFEFFGEDIFSIMMKIGSENAAGYRDYITYLANNHPNQVYDEGISYMNHLIEQYSPQQLKVFFSALAEACRQDPLEVARNAVEQGMLVIAKSETHNKPG